MAAFTDNYCKPEHVTDFKNICGEIRQFQESDFFIWKHPSEKFSTDALLAVAPETKAFLVFENNILYKFDSGTYRLTPEVYPLLLQDHGTKTFRCAAYFVHLNHGMQVICKAENPASMRDQAHCVCTLCVSNPKLLLESLIHGIPDPTDDCLREKLCRLMDLIFACAIDDVYEKWRHRAVGSFSVKKAVAEEFDKLLASCGLKIQGYRYLDIAPPMAEEWYKKAGSAGGHILSDRETYYDELYYEAPRKVEDLEIERDELYDLLQEMDTSVEEKGDSEECIGSHCVEIASAEPSMKPLPRDSSNKPAPPGCAPKKRKYSMFDWTKDIFSGAAKAKPKKEPQTGAAIHEPMYADEVPRYEESRSPRIQKIKISALAPKQFIKGDYSIVNVVLYEEAFREVVDALKSREDLEAWTTARVPDDARMRVCLSSPDVEIQDNDQEAQWYGEYLTFGFGVFMPVDYQKPSIFFHARIYINGVLASNLTFRASCVSLLEQKLAIERKDVLSAFVSYASEDRDEVIRMIQGIRKARSDMEIFLDVEGLRSGDDWQEHLYHEIDRRDILYLCWSRAARKSEWVDREWRYALKQKGEAGVDPLPLEPAEVCPPPEELDKKHFNDALIYLKKNRNW